ncbi:MAG: HU family DNA-binding protein [Lautropia sp.]|nr:HU family DNA-binding protein [Lautropia sp.]
MNKSELIDTISSEADISKAAAERALTSAMGAIMKAVAEGDRVTLVGFGTFHVSKRNARTGLNPRTGEKIEIEAAYVPKFSPGAAFKEAANANKQRK